MSHLSLISIVLPVYNGERFLEESISSCVAQSYINWELIIVNDASTDSSPQIAEKWAQKDRRIRVIHNEKNLKLPASLNRGFAEAKGEYFTWTSDDNLFEVDALEKLLQALTTAKADIVYANYLVIDDMGKVIKKSYLYPIKKIFINNVVMAAFLYRRDIHTFLKGYDEKKFLIEDYDFWLRAYVYHLRFVQIHDYLYRHRFHPNSLSGKYGRLARLLGIRYALNWIEQISLLSNAQRVVESIRILAYNPDILDIDEWWEIYSLQLKRNLLLAVGTHVFCVCNALYRKLVCHFSFRTCRSFRPL